jgi:hypothetical protein
MKNLEQTFVMNADKCGNHKFTQIRREAIVAAYKRNRVSDGRFQGVEVFLIKTIKEGAPLPGGGQVAEAYEQYPGASAFGRHAWSFTGIEAAATKAAMARFDTLLKGQIPVVEGEDETEIVVHVARVVKGEVKFQPPGEGWKGTQKELAAFLGLTNYKEAYTPLQKWLGAGILKVVGERDSLRGKKAKIFGRI